MKKPKWVVEKEQAKKAAAQETVWLFGLHAVRDALLNPNRQHLRLILTKNAADKMADRVGSGRNREILTDALPNAPRKNTPSGRTPHSNLTP